MNETQTANRVRLSDYERNGYHDSDFYGVWWDRDEKKIVEEVIGSTRGAGGRYTLHGDPDPTLEDIEAAIAFQAKKDAEWMVRKDTIAVEAPDSLMRGENVRMLKGCSFKDKKTGQTVKAKAGESGEIIWQGHFGQFYSNKPGRSNSRVGVRFEDGRVVFCAMSKVRLSREPISFDEALVRCERGVRSSLRFHSGPWDSDNYAAAVLKAA